MGGAWVASALVHTRGEGYCQEALPSAADWCAVLPLEASSTLSHKVPALAIGGGGGPLLAPSLPPACPLTCTPSSLGALAACSAGSASSQQAMLPSTACMQRTGLT